MACNDEEARRVIDSCERQDIPVPEQVAVLGVDNNVIFCEYSPVSLSTIDVDYANLGYRAAQLLHQQLSYASGDASREGPPPKSARTVRPVMLAPKGVVARRSTDVLAFSDPDVLEAMKLIRERAGSGTLSVEQLAESVSVSRRSLERKFRQAIGRTPGEEIRRVRMARARRLVCETELKITEIAAMTGFEYLPHFTIAFQREFGDSPTTYRSEHRYRALRHKVDNASFSAT